jgi:hypothetical protein
MTVAPEAPAEPEGADHAPALVDEGGATGTEGGSSNNDANGTKTAAGKEDEVKE